MRQASVQKQTLIKEGKLQGIILEKGPEWNMGGLWGVGRVRSQRWDSSGRKPSVGGGTFLLRTLCVLSLPLADVTPGETKLVFLLCCHVFLPSGHRFMEWKDVKILLVRVFFFSNWCNTAVVGISWTHCFSKGLNLPRRVGIATQVSTESVWGEKSQWARHFLGSE